MAITCLAHLDAMKRRGPRPCSLYLSHLVDCVQRHAPKSSFVFRQQLNLLQHIEKVGFFVTIIVIINNNNNNNNNNRANDMVFDCLLTLYCYCMCYLYYLHYLCCRIGIVTSLIRPYEIHRCSIQRTIRAGI